MFDIDVVIQQDPANRHPNRSAIDNSAFRANVGMRQDSDFWHG
jgi:hypothetical protein